MNTNVSFSFSFSLIFFSLWTWVNKFACERLPPPMSRLLSLSAQPLYYSVQERPYMAVRLSHSRGLRLDWGLKPGPIPRRSQSTSSSYCMVPSSGAFETWVGVLIIHSSHWWKSLYLGHIHINVLKVDFSQPFAFITVTDIKFVMMCVHQNSFSFYLCSTTVEGSLFRHILPSKLVTCHAHIRQNPFVSHVENYTKCDI